MDSGPVGPGDVYKRQIVDCFARRPQVQERLTGQIADFLYENLDPLGVAVFIQAEHLCMTMRGARAAGSLTRTCLLYTSRALSQERTRGPNQGTGK